MNSRYSKTLGAILTTLFIAGTLYGQSNFDLLPPRQADLDSEQVRMSSDPDALPRFQFAVASISDDKVEIITTAARQKMLAEAGAPKAPEGHVFYTENVTQNYTVSVPYTEMVDGKRISRVRTETKTRTVPLQRVRKMNEEELAAAEKKAAEEKKEGKVKEKIPVATPHAVEVPYFVTVPYTETNSEGEAVTKTRQVKRMRTVQVLRGKTETTSENSNSTYALDKIQCFNASGEAVDVEALKSNAEERRPVILIQSKDHIDPYFELILKPETLFVVIKKEG